MKLFRDGTSLKLVVITGNCIGGHSFSECYQIPLHVAPNAMEERETHISARIHRVRAELEIE